MQLLGRFLLVLGRTNRWTVTQQQLGRPVWLALLCVSSAGHELALPLTFFCYWVTSCFLQTHNLGDLLVGRVPPTCFNSGWSSADLLQLGRVLPRLSIYSDDFCRDSTSIRTTHESTTQVALVSTIWTATLIHDKSDINSVCCPNSAYALPRP